MQEKIEPKNYLPILREEKLLPEKQEHKDVIARSIVGDWSIPEFKFKYFVAGSQVHPLQKIKQMLIELNARQDAIENFNDDIDKLEAEIELEKEMKEMAQFEGQKKLHDIEIRGKTRRLGISKEKMRSLLNERAKVLKLIDEFQNSEEAIDPETGKMYIDILDDPEHFERIEAKYWEYRLAKQAATDMIAYGRIGVGNIDAIMQLEPEAQNKCLAMAYEVLLTNEQRMSMLADGVQSRLQLGKPVSDITTLLGIKRTETLQLLTNSQQEPEKDVPLIQKR